METVMIMGNAMIKEPQILADFVKRNNPDFDVEIAVAFIELGKLYSIRGDIAFCQSIIETGWFKFADGTAVKPEQHNYCGMGVLELGMTGNSFNTIWEGVEAQLQHLYAYGNEKGIISRPILDPRFNYVERGSAMYWEDLGGKWSSQKDYGEAIIKMHRQLFDFAMTHHLFVAEGSPIDVEQKKQEGTIIGKIAKPTLRVKDCDTEHEANEFLADKNAEDIVQIKPFLSGNGFDFRYSITYKVYK
ncbi:endolysin [Bacillus phage BCD7]|uniref:Putative cell wall hydrolase/autolysin n=1 Tax=Bacillus phage BCD7 TaxID=1136534 RepID=J9PUD3_9CAUD|nr:endolysin [Bacillus phage BCD7]AEZ50512.1 putative cell wall hydrolase/autolysin [Bacillus phage BCD7]